MVPISLALQRSEAMGGLGADPFMEDFQVPLEEGGGL